MKTILFLIISVTMYFSSDAAGSFSIRGTFSDTLIRKTIHVRFYTQYFEQCPTADTLIELVNNSFSFTSKEFTGPAYISMQYHVTKTHSPTRLFLVYPGENIRFELNSEGSHYSGKGAERFALYDTLFGLSYLKVSRLYAGSDVYNTLLRQESALDSLCRLRVSHIDQSPIDSYTASIMKLDALAERWSYSFTMLIGRWYGTKDSSTRNRLHRYYLDRNYENVAVNSGTGDKKVSAWLTTFLYEKARLAVLMQPGNKVSFRKLNEYIVRTYAGLDRSIALIEAFSLSQRFAPIDSLSFLLAHAARFMTEPGHKKMLTAFSGNLRKGMPAFNFALADYRGGTTRLRDLHGQVLLVDFWFTGCTGCKELARYKKPLMDSFSNRKDISFVSISVDRDKARWKKSVADEIYSSLDEINLYTNGMGAQHPLIRHYNYSGFPALLVIDRKGNIYDAAPPSPRSTESMIALLRLLEKAAGEK